MSDEPQLGWADQLVEFVAKTMTSIGLNGTRLQWKWRQHRHNQAERGMKREVLWRSAKGKHKMCTSCRALVARSASTCTECGADLSTVRAPGVGRMLANALPGGMSATSLLMLVNGLAFLLLLMSSMAAAAQPGGESASMFGFGRGILLRHGASVPVLVSHFGEWWRLVSANFLHDGLIHFGMNSMALMYLGNLAEDVYGTDRFWVGYLFSGVSGYLLVTALGHPYGSVTGSSCGISGMIGMLLAYALFRGGGRLRTMMVQYSLFLLVISFLPMVSFLGHAGGYIGGFLIGLVMPAGKLPNPSQNRIWQVLSLLGILLVLFAFYQVGIHGSDYLTYGG